MAHSYVLVDIVHFVRIPFVIGNLMDSIAVRGLLSVVLFCPVLAVVEHYLMVPEMEVIDYLVYFIGSLAADISWPLWI